MEAARGTVRGSSTGSSGRWAGSHSPSKFGFGAPRPICQKMNVTTPNAIHAALIDRPIARNAPTSGLSAPRAPTTIPITTSGRPMVASVFKVAT